MQVLHSLCILFTVLSVLVDCAPQNNFGFPDEENGADIPDQEAEDSDKRQGFFRPGSRRPGMRPGNFNPNGFPGDFPSGGSRPGRPGNGFPGNFPTNGGNRPGTGFRPSQPNNIPGTPLRPGNNQPTNNQPGNGNVLPTNPPATLPNGNVPTGQGVENTQGQTSTTSTTAAPSSTSTAIPPRDPTNRIVYTVSCPCPYTRQYAPVCGTDGQTYGNLGVFRCAQTCGANVDIFLMGACVRASNG